MAKALKILIVEDYAITALDLSHTLENLGFEISGIARTGEEALEKTLLNQPDLILMDIMLKGYYSGIETANFIRKQSSTPIIFITALKDDETFLKAYNTKPVAILNKPYNEKELQKAIKIALADKIIHIPSNSD